MTGQRIQAFCKLRIPLHLQFCGLPFCLAGAETVRDTGRCSQRLLQLSVLSRWQVQAWRPSGRRRSVASFVLSWPPMETLKGSGEEGGAGCFSLGVSLNKNSFVALIW